MNLRGTAQSRFYLFDASGSTRAPVDKNGALLARGAYRAWGTPLGYTPNNLPAWNGRRGRHTDAKTGLILMGARYCFPAIERFLSRDPICFAAGASMYACRLEEPIDLSDPDGTDPGESWGRTIGRYAPRLNFTLGMRDVVGAVTNFGTAYGQRAPGESSRDGVLAAEEGLKHPLGDVLGSEMGPGMMPGEGAADRVAEDWR